MFTSDPVMDVHAFKASKNLFYFVLVLNIFGNKEFIVGVCEIHKHLQCNFASG